MSGKYGKHILSAMGALGQAGAYMVQTTPSGFQGNCTVTVLDYTSEMIAEGIKRFGTIRA